MRDLSYQFNEEGKMCKYHTEISLIICKRLFWNMIKRISEKIFFVGDLCSYYYCNNLLYQKLVLGAHWKVANINWMSKLPWQ
jgi:hypothetical protein